MSQCIPFRMPWWLAALAWFAASTSWAGSPEENARMLQQQWAADLGTLAYVYGYPMVDMQKQMHNETHRLDGEQIVVAPVNRFYRFTQLLTPETQGNLRAANSDTLYFSGWFDLTEPVVVHLPPTGDRYYSLMITDFYSEVQHVSRRTHGGKGGDYALVGPGWQGTLPAGLTEIQIPTTKAWILGRMMVDHRKDLPAARHAVEQVYAVELSGWQKGRAAPKKEPPRGTAIDPLGTLDFFQLLNEALRANPMRPGEEALMALFDQIGVGPGQTLDLEALDEPTRKGLAEALQRGRQLVELGAFRTMAARNGWIFLLDAGRYGANYLHRAATALGGYANLPEESVYPATLVDGAGQRLNGKHRYRVHFAADSLPPVAAFWSLSLYDENRILARNDMERYSIGDRTEGLQYHADGSLTLHLQHDAPERDQRSNWLPAPKGPFMAVMRLYEPHQDVLSGTWVPPTLERVD